MTDRENKIVRFFKKWEGGYSNHPLDTGGCTMIGVTIGTYRNYFGQDKTCDDLKHIKDEEWLYIFRKGYYNLVKADNIINDSIALMVVDMAWMSGPITTIKQIQQCFNLKVDGIIGKITLAALNGDPKVVFNKLYQMRKNYFLKLVDKRPSNKVFLKGWLNRLNDIKYEN